MVSMQFLSRDIILDFLDNRRSDALFVTVIMIINLQVIPGQGM